MERQNSILPLEEALLRGWTAKKLKISYTAALLFFIVIVSGQQIPALTILTMPVIQKGVIPVLSIMIVVIYYAIVPKVSMIGRFCDKSSFVGWSLIFAGSLITIKVVAALLTHCLGKNPYDLSLEGMAANLWTVVPEVMLQELLRFCGLNSCRKSNRMRVFLGFLILYTILKLNFSELIQLSGEKQVVVYLFQVILPTLMEQILCNLLAWFGGFAANLSYALIPELFTWMFPVLPMLNWFAEAVIGIAVVAAFCFHIYDRYEKQLVKKAGQKKENMLSTAIVLAFCVLLVWFFTGVFPIYPSIVLTGSMEPDIMPGDLILISKYTSQEQIMEIEPGEIVNFNRDEINITHRVLEIVTDKEGTIMYRTKGDNNPSADTRLVEMSEMNGELIATIPRIGLPVLWLKGNDAEMTGKEINGQ